MFELSEVIQSHDFAQAARHPDFPQAFTRTRKLPLPGLIAALLSQRGQSQQVTLDSFFASLCDTAQPVRGISDRAFAKARDQLYMPALSGLNDLLMRRADEAGRPGETYAHAGGQRTTACAVSASTQRSETVIAHTGVS